MRYADIMRLPPAVRIGARSHAGRLRLLVETLLLWQERASQRQELARLDDRMLRDIGISRTEVACECAKPFWRP